MPMFGARKNLQRASALAAINVVGNEPPKEIELFPAGEDIKARDGREFSNPDPQSVLAAFADKRVQLCIDWEHAQDHKAVNGERAPAAGWITALYEKAGAIWAVVDWTAAGAADLIAKAYKYISPTFYVDEDGVLISIEGAGLVNRPALDLPALAREQPSTEGDFMKREDLIKMLGLKAEATDAEIEAAVKANAQKAIDAEATAKASKEAAEKAAADAKEASDKAAKAEQELQAARAQGSDLSKVVPRSEYDALKTQVTTLETAAKKRDEDERAARVERALDDATREGKIAPADRDFYKQSCSSDAGFESFKKHMASKAPNPIKDPVLDNREPVKGSGSGGDLTAADITKEQRAFLQKSGFSEEQYLKTENARRKQLASQNA